MTGKPDQLVNFGQRKGTTRALANGMQNEHVMNGFRCAWPGLWHNRIKTCNWSARLQVCLDHPVSATALRLAPQHTHGFGVWMVFMGQGKTRRHANLNSHSVVRKMIFEAGII
jgi:hypothetical protein